MFRHVLWDFDGTLFDTYPCMTYALDKALRKRGIVEPESEIYAQLKKTTGIALRHFTEKHSLDGGLREDFLTIRIAAEADMCLPYPGIRELLEDINSAGCCNYISTNRSSTLFPILDRQGMTHLFRDFATSDDGLPLKPDPAMNLRLIEKYGMDPDETVIVGDRELDILSGQRAGIHTIAYLDGTGAPIDCAEAIANDIPTLRDMLLR